MNEVALKARLKSIAIEKNMTFNQIWKQFLLERFLARLSISEHREKFIFKGGLLLASYLDIGRETVDIDFSLKKLKAISNKIKSAIIDISEIQIMDGLTLKWDRFEILDQPHMGVLFN